MQENKKGFTLVELIAVIVLVIIVSTISVTGVISISKIVKERQYNSLISTIKVAAEKFASEKGVKTVIVQTLINEGLIETDDETNYLYDPRDNAILNCKVIKIENNKADVTDEDIRLDDNTCDEKILTESEIVIKYRYEGESVSNKFEDNKWLSKDIILMVELSGELKNIDKEKLSYSWISPLAPDEVVNDEEYPLEENLLRDVFQVTITSNGVDYKTHQQVLMDKLAPNVLILWITIQLLGQKKKIFPLRYQIRVQV